MKITHFIRKEEVGKLSDKAIERTTRMGATCVKETIALLENEIDLYRKRVDFLEHELERAKEQHTQAEYGSNQRPRIGDKRRYSVYNGLSGRNFGKGSERLKDHLIKAINESNMKISVKADLIKYITDLERKIFGLETKVKNYKEKEEKSYRNIR